MQAQAFERAAEAANARADGLSQQLTAAHDRTVALQAELQQSQQMQVRTRRMQRFQGLAVSQTPAVAAHDACSVTMSQQPVADHHTYW